MRRAAAAGLLVLALGACQPIHFGASIMSQSSAWSGFNGPVYAQSGATPAQGHSLMSAHVDEQSGPIVIGDFEHNGVLDGVWGSNDHNAYFAMVFMRERCTVVILGWRTTGVTEALNTARADIAGLAEARRSLGHPTVVIDWRPVLEGHPEWVVADGVHVNQAGADGYVDFVNNGIGLCP